MSRMVWLIKNTKTIGRLFVGIFYRANESLIKMLGVEFYFYFNCLIYGFKDWQNYHYFVISRKYIYVGSFFEGVKSISIDGMYCSSINPSQEVSIKILSTGDKDYFSINGEIQYKDDSNKLYGNNFGFIVCNSI